MSTSSAPCSRTGGSYAHALQVVIHKVASSDTGREPTLQAVIGKEPVLNAARQATVQAATDREPVLEAGREPAGTNSNAASVKENFNQAPEITGKQEHVVRLADQQQGADPEHFAPDVKLSKELADEQPTKEESIKGDDDMKSERVPVDEAKQMQLVKLADKQQGADARHTAPDVHLGKEAIDREPAEKASVVNSNPEQLVKLADQQQGADAHLPAPDLTLDVEGFTKELAERAAVTDPGLEQVAKLADKQQGADPVEQAPDIKLSRGAGDLAVQGR